MRTCARRAREGVARTLAKREIEERLEELLRQGGQAAIQRLREAAEYCGLTRDSFKKKVVRDQLRKVRLDKCWRFDKADLDAWIDSHKEQIIQETAA